MGRLKWYKRDPRAAMVGMAGMNFADRGAYNSILDLMYCHDGELVDDDRQIAHQISVDIRTWRVAKKRLLALRKIYLADGYIRNERVAIEVRTLEILRRNASRAGTVSALKRGAKNIKFNGLEPTDVERPFQLTTTRLRESYPTSHTSAEQVEQPTKQNGLASKQAWEPSAELIDRISDKGWNR